MKNIGKLFGVGVGPGDPELITVKAVRVIKEADIIFTAASTKNTYSLAVEIASPYISTSAQIEKLSFPMTKDVKEVEAAWIHNAKQIAGELKQGKNAVFLTLGDPTTYSTFGYILKKMACIMPEADIETIPGITSFHAASARLNRILVEGEESLLVTSGAYGGDQIRNINGIENIAIVKAYKNIQDINKALKETGLDNNSVAVSKCGRKNEQIIEDLDELEKRSPDYWTLILASK
ncbi:MAG: precorrin-2 C(20)-methyltransferase [Deltaproteobacteria bacterium]|uniref:precorrin-2 C(20)-methyltransferase n=1 Tax=Desulfobacula sp. TaxID=2593537 RepID=UPI001989836D|nr:precorrin-2 C(20)-methyltransferase [Candidatus Desulfobacula maris]MBL6994026.1 precorrin-2 C(20)-methyltransferase [Desulfobacula sp.]